MVLIKYWAELREMSKEVEIRCLALRYGRIEIYGGKRRVRKFHGLDFMVGNNGYGVFYALLHHE